MRKLPKTRAAGAACLVLLVGIGCSYRALDAGEGAVSKASAFFPITVGQSWTYAELARGYVVATEHWNVQSADNGVYRVEFRTVRHDSLAQHDPDGKRIAAVNYEYVVVTADGIARTRTPGVPATADYVMRNPILEGASWGDERNRCRISALGVTDTLSVTDYQDCVEVTCEMGVPPALRIVSRYARGVGLISQRISTTEYVPIAGPRSADSSRLGGNEDAPVESILVLQPSPP
jgi:hypothetical protein